MKVPASLLGTAVTDLRLRLRRANRHPIRFIGQPESDAFTSPLALDMSSWLP